MNLTKPKKLGIIGGTFDPIHYGHLLIAQSAAEEFNLDQVLFLPTGTSPHKEPGRVTAPDIRCGMVQTAIADNPRFGLSVLEAENPQINYTCLTLKKFHQLYRGTELYFIMGEDSLDDFSTWKNPSGICRLATILTAVRDGGRDGLKEKIETAEKIYGGRIELLHTPNFSISSKEIRRRIREGKSVRYMLPKEVELFIKKHSLYAF